MAINFCDLATALNCSPSPDDELFKSLVLRALATLVTSAVATSGAAVVLPQVVKTFTQLNTIGNVYTNLGLLDATKKLKRLYVVNNTDVDIEISFDSGVTTALRVLANNSLYREFGNFTAPLITSMMIREPTGMIASLGSAYFDGSY